MKLRIIILAFALVLLSFASAFPADGTFEGEIGATGVIDRVSGSKAKFSEYKDETKGGGFYSDIRLRYDSDNYWMNFNASDIGYKTQNYTLEGGMYQKLTYELFYNEIIHNITSDAKSFYSGIGSNSLTGSWTSKKTLPTNPATWNTFDYYTDRKQYGGGIEFDMLKPFYVNFSVSREDRSGILPTAGPTITGGGPSTFVELPAPVQYTTDIVMGEIGYQAKPVFASINYLYSGFSNNNDILGFQSPYSTLMDQTTLPPDNNYYKLGFKGSVQLPMNTRFNVNLNIAHATSDTSLLQNYILTNSATFLQQVITRTLSSNTFNGKLDTQNYNFTLTSNPVSFLDGKIFYKYYNTTNKSDLIGVTDPKIAVSTPNALGTPGSGLFDYKKNSFGVDLGWRLPGHFHLDTDYNYVNTDRSRVDIPSTIDHIYSAELRWNGLDFLTPKIGYERLQRIGAGPLAADLALVGGNPADQWFTRFDADTQNRDTYKVAVDASPLDNLDLGAAYKYIKSDYPNALLGLQNTKTNEFDVYGGYTIGRIARVNAYFDLQNIKSYTYEVSFNNVPSLSGSTTGATAGNYNWSQAEKDDTYEYGASVDFYVVPKKVTLRLQYDYVNSDGSADFTYYGVSGATALTALSTPAGLANQDNIDIGGGLDTYKKSAFMAKVIYDVSKSVTLALAACFESYKYNDVSLNNYQYVWSNATGTSTYYLTGAYANPSYNASVVFITARYKF